MEINNTDIVKSFKIIDPQDQIWQRVEELENVVHLQGLRMNELEERIKSLEKR